MDNKKDSSPGRISSRPKDLIDVEMIGNPTSTRAGRPEIRHINERKHEQETHHDKPHPDSDAETVPTQRLLEPDRERPKPPLAGPEVDDLDGDEKLTDSTPGIGIDDGLLEPTDRKPNGHDVYHGDHEGSDVNVDHKEDGDAATEDGKLWPLGTDETDFAYDGVNGYGPPRFGGYDPDRPISPGTIIPDVNTYQQKKNLAQGMMDLALLSANANQLRYVLESSSSHPYYFPSLAFISMSIILQVAVGVGLIMNSRYNVKDDKDICKADKINNMTVLGVFLITIVNVFITSFSVATPNTTTTAVQTIGSG